MHSRRIFFRGYILPFAAVYAAYFSYVSVNEASVYGRDQAFPRFRLDYIFNDDARTAPAPEVVIVGDSGAKVGLNPEVIARPSSVNLAALYGNALSAYETMAS